MISEPVPSWATEIQFDLPVRGVDEAIDYVGPDYQTTPRTSMCLVQRETSRGRDALRAPAMVAIFHDDPQIRLSEAELRAHAVAMLDLADQLAKL